MRDNEGLVISTENLSIPYSNEMNGECYSSFKKTDNSEHFCNLDSSVEQTKYTVSNIGDNLRINGEKTDSVLENNATHRKNLHESACEETSENEHDIVTKGDHLQHDSFSQENSYCNVSGKQMKAAVSNTLGKLSLTSKIQHFDEIFLQLQVKGESNDIMKTDNIFRTLESVKDCDSNFERQEDFCEKK